jgi:hypothetical protein
MTKRFLLSIALFLAIIFAIVVPFIFQTKEETVNQTINASASILSSIAALLTLIIALLLFNKYGVESPLIEKSSSKVFALLEEIKQTSFSIGNDRFYFWIKMSDPFKYSAHIEKYYGEKLIFSNDYIYGLDKLFEISNNPFIPKDISEKMDKLQYFSLSFDVKESEQTNYTKVSVARFKKSEELTFGRFNSQDLTLFEFLKILDEVRIEVVQWIQNNSSINIKLNL